MKGHEGHDVVHSRNGRRLCRTCRKAKERGRRASMDRCQVRECNGAATEERLVDGGMMRLCPSHAEAVDAGVYG